MLRERHFCVRLEESEEMRRDLHSVVPRQGSVKATGESQDPTSTLGQQGAVQLAISPV